MELGEASCFCALCVDSILNELVPVSRIGIQAELWRLRSLFWKLWEALERLFYLTVGFGGWDTGLLFAVPSFVETTIEQG